MGLVPTLSAPPINYIHMPKIIQAESQSEKFFKSPLEASKLSVKVFYHIILTLDIWAY